MSSVRSRAAVLFRVSQSVRSLINKYALRSKVTKVRSYAVHQEDGLSSVWCVCVCVSLHAQIEHACLFKEAHFDTILPRVPFSSHPVIDLK